MEPQRLAWSAYEAGAEQKSADWYWALGIIAVAGSASAAIFGNVLFAIVIIVGAIALSLNAARGVHESNIELNQKGFVINSRLYPYKALASFWVEERTEEHPRLFIKSTSTFTPQIIVPILSVPPEKVHDFLLEYLEEEEMAEPLSQKILEFFGF